MRESNATATSPENASHAPSLSARIAAMPKGIQREAGPPLAVSIEAANAAVASCKQKGALVSVLVADAHGEPVVLLSGDGAGFRSQLIAQSKVNIVTRWHRPSGEVEKLAKSEPDLVTQAAADPGIGILRGGGFPIMDGAKQIGALAVSGGSLFGPHTLDDDCAQAALAVFASKMR